MQNEPGPGALKTDEGTGPPRIELFSDAVVAIAITLLVIELKVPHVESPNSSLLAEVAKHWPEYAAYLVSFWSIGLAWVIHHNMFKLIHRVDHMLLLLNMVFLLFIAFVPHPTAIVAEYLQQPGQKQHALVIYSSVWLMVAVMINLLWWYASTRGLLVPTLDRQTARRIFRRYLYGPPLYALALLIALVSFEAALVVYAVTGVLYTLPGHDARVALDEG